MQVFDERGQPVSMADVKAAEPLTEYAIALAAAKNIEQLRIDQAYLTTQLNALDAVMGTGASSPAAAPAQDPRYTTPDPNWRPGANTPAREGARPAASQQGALGGFLGQSGGGPQVSLPGSGAENVDLRAAAQAATSRTGALETGRHQADDVRNPLSSATGRGQFIDGTWLDMIKRNRPDLAQGRNDAGILELRKDPRLSMEMVEQYAMENGAKLQRAGVPVNPETLYLAHHFGPRGAINILSADPNTPMAQLLSPAEIRANPTYRGKTVGQVLASFNERAGGSGALASRGAPARQAPAAASTAGDDPRYASITDNINRALGAG
jgi:hypothetical protein